MTSKNQSDVKPSEIKYADFLASLEQGLNVISSKDVGLVWPLETPKTSQHLLINVCGRIPNVEFTQNPATVKNNEGVIPFIEIDLATLALAPEENPLDAVKKRFQLIIQKLVRARIYCGVMIVLGSTDKLNNWNAHPLHSILASLTTEHTRLLNYNGYFEDIAIEANIDDDNPWRPTHILAFSIQSVAETYVDDLKVLGFSKAYDSDEVTSFSPIDETLDEDMAQVNAEKPEVTFSVESDDGSDEFQADIGGDEDIISPQPTEYVEEMSGDEKAELFALSQASEANHNETLQAGNLSSVTLPITYKNANYALVLGLTDIQAFALDKPLTEIQAWFKNLGNVIQKDVEPFQLTEDHSFMLESRIQILEYFSNTFDLDKSDGNIFATEPNFRVTYTNKHLEHNFIMALPVQAPTFYKLISDLAPKETADV